MRVAVIGGGPSGLVTLKYLKTAHEFFPGEKPINARLFEAKGEIGGAFKYRNFEGAELGSSRQLITFSDYRFAPDFAECLCVAEYCDYLEGYTRRFGLTDPIHLSTTVTNVDRSIRGGHIVHYIKDGCASKWACDAVAICSGLHATPNIPNIQGIEYVPLVLNSSEFKDKTQFGVGKNILILGAGEGALDIASLAITSTPTNLVFLDHRDGSHSAQKRFLNPFSFELKPKGNVLLDFLHNVGSARLRFFSKDDSSWLHYDMFAKRSMALISGTKVGLDQRIGRLASKLSPNFPIGSIKTFSYIRNQYQRIVQPKCHQSKVVQAPTLVNNERRLEIVPWPKQFLEGGILHFTDCDRPEASGREKEDCKVDSVIFDTGYNQSFPFLGPSYPLQQQANVRSIWKNNEHTVGFIGFVRPSLGAIPPISEMQAQLWVLKLLNLIPAPLKDEEDNCYHHFAAISRIAFGVDQEFYVYQLALDMGSVPSLSEILENGGLKLAFIWAITLNFNSKFRLVGPWRWSEAKRVMGTEMWGHATRRRNLLGSYIEPEYF